MIVPLHCPYVFMFQLANVIFFARCGLYQSGMVPENRFKLQDAVIPMLTTRLPAPQQWLPLLAVALATWRDAPGVFLFFSNKNSCVRLPSCHH
jgi:hypothetical protein